MEGVDIRGAPGDRAERRQRVPRPGTRSAEGGRHHGTQHARDRVLDTGIGICGRAKRWYASSLYRVTHQVVANLPLTSKQKFCLI